MRYDGVRIAAVIVTYNRLELLKECVNAVRSQTHPLNEIIVVNNSSTDGTLEWLNEQEDLTVITQENGGSAGGQYTGIKTAYEKGHDWIWCMDDDVYPHTMCLQYIISFIISMRDTISSVSCVRRYKGSNEFCYGEIINYNPKKLRNSKRFRIGDSKLFQTCKYIEILSGTFEGMCINANAIREIGLPNKDLFLCYDDVEYSLRLGKAGKNFLSCEAIMYKNIASFDYKQVKSINNGEIIKYLYSLRNLVYLELNILNNREFKVRVYLSFLFYLKRVFLLILSSNAGHKKRLRFYFIVRAFISIKKGFIGELGRMDFKI